LFILRAASFTPASGFVHRQGDVAHQHLGGAPGDVSLDVLIVLCQLHHQAAAPLEVAGGKLPPLRDVLPLQALLGGGLAQLLHLLHGYLGGALYLIHDCRSWLVLY